MSRVKKAMSAAALCALAGAAHAQPLRMDFDVGAVSPGLYSYSFTVTLDPTIATWNPGMGWGWLNFGSGRHSSFLQITPTNFAMTSPFPGPWTSLGTVGGANNGPIFQPVGNNWIPTSAGETLVWTGTSPIYVDTPEMRWSTVIQVGGAVVVNFPAATRVPAGPIGGCCLADGSCIWVSAASCTNAGGAYNGDGTTCATTTCNPPTGACCRQSGCVTTNAVVCTRTGGTYAGDGVACGSAGCAAVAPFSLTPPDFTATSRVWVYGPSYSQTISGAGFRATGFQLAGYADRGIETLQSDLVVEIISPNNTRLVLGGDNTNPQVVGSTSWASIRRTGGSPASSNNAASFNGTYSWDFGPADGVWTVNFWNNFAQTSSPNVPPRAKWNNMIVTLQNAGSGACCMPDGTCIDTAVGNCTVASGIYRGDGVTCGAANCPGPFVFTANSNSSMTAAGNGIFLNLTAGQNSAVDRFDYAATAASGTPTTVEVWTYPGSYLGHDASQTGWTLHETVNGVSGGTSTLVPLNLTNPIPLTAGNTTGVYLINQAGGMRFFVGSPFNYGATAFQVFSDRRRDIPWAGTVSTSSIFAGRVFYDPTCTGACPYALLTPFPSTAVTTNNSGSFFDLTAAGAVTIDRIDYYPGSAVGTPSGTAVYTKTGSYVGFDTNAAAWTLVNSYSGTSQATNEPVTLDLSATPISMAAGETRAFYIVGTTGGYRYHATTNPVNDSRLSMESNITRSSLFGGTLNTGRRFAGRVHYTTGGTTCYANCDGSTTPPVANVADFTCFLQKFAALDPYANCDGSTLPPTINVADFTCFLQKFAAGCP